MSDRPSEVTDLLKGVKKGDSSAESRLYDLIFSELRKIAARQLRRERYGHSLQATELVNEAWIRLKDQQWKGWNNRSHFLAVAAQVMRRILVDYARRRHSEKRDGDRERVDFSELTLSSIDSGFGDVALVDLDMALIRLAEMDVRQAQVVECRFFGGMTDEETADALKVSSRTVKREWKMARAWLYGELRGDGPAAPPS